MSEKAWWLVFSLTITISTWFWGSIVWFFFLQFFFTENISDGITLATFLGMLASIIHGGNMAGTKTEKEYIFSTSAEKFPHSFEAFELLMLMLCVGWVGAIYDVIISTILEIRNFFRQASET